MKGNIIVIGGIGKSLATAFAAHSTGIATIQERKVDVRIDEAPVFGPEPLPYASAGIEFICKGKHQYRNIKDKWVCQCGRSL